MKSKFLGLLVAGLLAPLAANAVPITYDISSDVVIGSSIGGMLAGSTQSVTGTLTIESDFFNFYAEAGEDILGYSFATDIYGFGQEGVLGLNVSVGGLNWDADDLVLGTYASGTPYSLIYVWGDLLAPSAVSFFAYEDPGTYLAWSNLHYSDTTNVIDLLPPIEIGDLEGGGGYARGVGTPLVSVSVPEPTTLALFGAGLIGMGLARRRRKI